MRILALDPSSTQTGYSVWDNGRIRCHGLLDAGKRDLDPLQRVYRMARDLAALVSEEEIHAVVIEINTSRFGTARKAGGTMTLQIYGLAMGYLLAMAHTTGLPVFPVEANEWTRYFAPRFREKKSKDVKEWRRILAKQTCPAYDPAKDRGGNKADAILIGRWYIEATRDKPCPAVPSGGPVASYDPGRGSGAPTDSTREIES